MIQSPSVLQDQLNNCFKKIIYFCVLLQDRNIKKYKQINQYTEAYNISALMKWEKNSTPAVDQ